MKIRDIMRREPITVWDTDPLGIAQRWMAKYHIRHLPVLAGGKLVGMLAERDLLQARAHADGDEDWWRMPVREAMQPSPQTVHPDDSVTEVAGRMAYSKLDAFPVIDHGKLVGVVSVVDVLDAEVRDAMASRGETAIGDLGDRPPVIRSDQPLFDAVTLMYDHHVHDLPVVDSDGRLVGMLSEADVRHAIGDPAAYLDSTRSRRFDVQDVMETGVPTIAADRPIAELAHCFADPRREAVAVVDQTGTPVGVVSYIDALHALAT